MKVFNQTIHHRVTEFKEFHFKMALDNYLTLNNEHKTISFTYLRSFNYKSMDLLEYSIHSISMIFMIIQAVRL